MLEGMMEVLKMLLNLVWWCVKVLGVALAPMLLSMLGWYIYYRVKGMRVPRRSGGSLPRRNILVRLFWDFPRRLVLDRFTLNPDAFRETGLHLFVGEQGSGKTLSAVHFIQQMKKKYPRAVVRSNITLAGQDGNIECWQDLVFNANAEYGQIEFIDEIQNWFNSMESKDFPPDMLQEICQQRKQRKAIVGTAQVFARVAKPIREQVTYLYKPMTLFGCLTIVRKSRPQVMQDGSIGKLRPVKTYFFVQSEELRSAYDTYEKVKRVSLKGFQPRSEQYNAFSVPAVSVVIAKDKEKKTP